MIRLTTAALVLATLASAAVALRTAQEMPVPQQQHAFLMKGVGEWEGTLTMHAPGMSADPAPCRDTITAIGEFWTSSMFRCSLMDTPLLGTGVTGYDPERKLFVGTWVDSMTTRLTVMEGKLDESKNTLVMRYVGPDPMTGDLVPHRIETVHEGDSSTSNFFMGEGEGVKSMTIAMKRVK